MAPTVRDATRATDPPGDATGRPPGLSAGEGAPGRDRAGSAAGTSSVAAELRRMLVRGELDLPVPGSGRTADRWSALVTWGGRDLSLARLAEGHVDALAILAEAGRLPVPGALYGVWASRSGGAAVRLERRGGDSVLDGMMRFCSGARLMDRALVIADPPGASAADRVLLDVDLGARGVAAVPGSWCTAAMADADTLDVTFDAVPVAPDAQVGEPGWYVGRRGFALGGGGVAAVWWGGAAGVLDRVLGHLGTPPDRHALAHVGELHATLAGADALLQRTATLVDTAAAAPTQTSITADVVLAVAVLRAAVERAARDVVDRAPRIVGPGPLSRDAGLARMLADLALYVRQHHAERDHAALGEQILDQRRRA